MMSNWIDESSADASIWLGRFSLGVLPSCDTVIVFLKSYFIASWILCKITFIWAVNSPINLDINLQTEMFSF